jgi:senataxin
MSGEQRSIGIITPYKEQLKKIKEKLRMAIPKGTRDRVVVSTVDSFQGQEVDTVIISCVRSKDAVSSARGSIGFLSDSRRLNVAITRAKSSLIVVGNVDWLSKCNDTWRALLTYLREAGNSAYVDEEGRLRKTDGQIMCPALDTSPHVKRLEEGGSIVVPRYS